VSEEALTRFGRALRHEGLAVGTGRIEGFCRAAALLSPDDLYWVGLATLVSGPEDIPAYDRVYRTFFGALAGAKPPEPPRVLVRIEEREAGLASGEEVLREKSFAACSREELARLAELMTGIELAVPERRTRRRVPARRGRPDLRRTLRRSFLTGGEPLEQTFRGRSRRRRRLILFLDVSGSMDAHARALVLFAHAALRARRNWEAFCFGTRLTRVTGSLKGTDPDEALRRAAEEVLDWSGGTRIGESLERFLRAWGHGGLARGAVVVICSDGLEVGDPAHLGEQMAHLRRLAFRIVWLNPLKEDPAYEPLARGMKAALPHVDLFASGHSLASLEEVGAALARL
jgi:uncharacterized protein with von Willebrand factor type A (vWA) domain